MSQAECDTKSKASSKAQHIDVNNSDLYALECAVDLSLWTGKASATQQPILENTAFEKCIKQATA
jgi:hypothetical protein